MYRAFIDCSYDEELKKIRHFTLHPELLPYVGAHYRDFGIILIGESHYVNIKDIFENWYNESAGETWINASARLTPEEFTGWFNTREIVNNYLCGITTQAHHIFQYPAEIIRNSFPEYCPSDRSAFCMTAFFNYFQRPTASAGATFDALDKSIIDEALYAGKIADEIFDILKPRKIIFLSKKAYDAYCSYRGAADNRKEMIDYVNHPCSAGWNGENGRTRFVSLIESAEPPKCGAVIGSSVIELFAEKLHNALIRRGFGEAELCGEGDDSFKHYHDPNNRRREYRIISVGRKCTVCAEERIYIRYGEGGKDWQYLPGGGQDPNVSGSPNFRKPNSCRGFPTDDEALDSLAEKCAERIAEITGE